MKIKINGNSFNVEFKKLFFPFLILLVVVIIFLKFSELKEIGNLLLGTKWYLLILVFISQIVNFTLQGNVYLTTFKILKYPQIGLLKLTKIAVTIIFLNFTIPSLGFAGNLWFLKKVKSSGISEGKGLMTIIVEFTCYYLALIFLLLISLGYLFFRTGGIDNAQKIAIAGLSLVILLVATITYYFLGDKERAKSRIVYLAQKIDKAEDNIAQEERVQELLKEFYENFDWLKNNKIKLLKPTIVQFIKFLSDALTIFLIFFALGHIVPFGVAVVAFALGRLFGMITLIPGGLGAFEGSTILILNSLGASLELAVAVTLVYRLFSYWAYMPLGLWHYKYF